MLSHAPPKMQMLASGRAVVGFRENFWIDQKLTNTWTEVALDLATNKPALDQFKAALMKPVFDFKLDHSGGFDMPLPQLMPAKHFCQWLGPSLQNSLRNGENQAALDDLLAALKIPRVLENDPIVISELVRIAIASINRGSVWEALQADAFTEQQLALVQAAWEQNTFATNMLRSLRIERADCEVSFERFRKSNEDTYRCMFPNWMPFLTSEEDESSHWWQNAFFRKQIYCRIWRFAWSSQDERYYLEGMQRLIEDQRTGAERALQNQEENWWLPFAKAPRQNFYDAWRFGVSAQSLASLSRATLKSAQAETQRSLGLCAIALKRYSLRHGKFPDSLAALVPDFLASVPTDYMDGKPVKYRRNEDGSFILYSVGEDGKDDGGDGSLPPGKEKSSNLWARKDFIWPSPATLEEVLAWRKAAGKN